MKRVRAQLTIGQLARRSGIGKSTVRYYERTGLLQQPDRTASNYRVYPDEAVMRVNFIRRVQQLGFTLEEIKGLLEMGVNRRTTCADVRSRAHSKINDIETRIKSLRRMSRALAKLADECEARSDGVGCPLLEYLEGKI
jgi:Hg(II)-responsive transcriptional regulator